MQDVKEFARKNFIFLLFIGLGLILCIVGFFEYQSSQNSKSEIKFTTVDSNPPTQALKSKVSIDVAGKVIKPGVYELVEGSRLQDALIAAGGMSSNADRAYVSKKINLAQKVTDGAKIYIPAVGEMEVKQEALASISYSEGIEVDMSEDDDGLININTAGLERLETLPKVGPVTGQKIIGNRPYGSIEELVSKKVLGQKTFDGLKDFITTQ